MRGATSEPKPENKEKLISIHAPHAGCDLIKKVKIKDWRISIHAPHAGCDTIFATRKMDL